MENMGASLRPVKYHWHCIRFTDSREDSVRRPIILHYYP